MRARRTGRHTRCCVSYRCCMCNWRTSSQTLPAVTVHICARDFHGFCHICRRIKCQHH